MPTFTGEDIYRIAHRLLRAAGAPDDHASTVAGHLADANLAGHDSHGFIRIVQYVKEIQEGIMDPKARPEVMRETAGTAQVNGNHTFGQVAATLAMRLAIEKARQCGVSLVTLCNHGHTGRIGTYTEMAAKEGMAAIMCTGFVGGTIARNVAPFGGRERRLGTNPISMAFPYSSEGPVLLDFATSVTSEGKLRVYRARGKELPDEWVINTDGVPSRDPNDYYNGGALLPLGGPYSGYKGYALDFMVALFGSVLARLECPDAGEKYSNGGSSIIVIDVGGMAPIDGVRTRVEEVVQYVKDTPPMEGFREVLHPGEVEVRSRRERRANGVPIEQATWDQVVGLIKENGLEEELGPLN